MTTSELGRSLDAEFAELTPPSAITGESIIHKGRQVRVRRRLFGGGAVMAGLAAVVAAVLVVPGLLPGSVDPDAARPPYPPVDQPEFPLPELDPAGMYVWFPREDASRTPETEAISAAWLESVLAIDGAIAYSYEGEDPTSPWQPLAEDNYDHVLRSWRALAVTYPSDPEGFFRPLDSGEYLAPLYSGGSVALVFADGVWPEELSVEVHAKGSFLPGVGEVDSRSDWEQAPYVVHGCAGMDDDPNVLSYSCTNSTGPNGEAVATVEYSMARPSGVASRRQVALFRTDGTAVVVSDSLTPLSEDVGIIDGQGGDFVLTGEDLLDLALGIPPVPVK
ncbi:hypothetical protein AB0I28_20575 [Phytomonospora sp. NPDC050363]|uniref:hypothetical protein n=1 Tax=Phytomonospora sp. NPDC050363 TaxID=3155642 RepID=UPI00340EA46F